MRVTCQQFKNFVYKSKTGKIFTTPEIMLNLIVPVRHRFKSIFSALLQILLPVLLVLHCCCCYYNYNYYYNYYCSVVTWCRQSASFLRES